ncbi:hypothetical protein ABT063_24675 [Streptomyces sp. NPDC002838]|uniref:hypothetical protein n=1 Tax=Streptomyces sp. NPDC002838 TaxID=3154436 RepID=UPI003323F042
MTSTNTPDLNASREEFTPEVKGPQPRLTVDTITSDQLDELYYELAEMRGSYERACQTIAAMHKAAVGEIRGPIRGVVEDVEDVRKRAEQADAVTAETKRLMERRTTTLRERAERAEAERDGAYRERAHLLALLAALYPSVIAPAPDVDEDGWKILYLRIGGKQASWHIAPRDAELYAHVEHVPADDRRAQWDGHTTEQKYAHIGQYAARLYAAACGRVETALTPAPAPSTPLVDRPFRSHRTPGCACTYGQRCPNCRD